MVGRDAWANAGLATACGDAATAAVLVVRDGVWADCGWLLSVGTWDECARRGVARATCVRGLAAGTSLGNVGWSVTGARAAWRETGDAEGVGRGWADGAGAWVG